MSLALSLAVCGAVSCGGTLAPDHHDNGSADLTGGSSPANGSASRGSDSGASSGAELPPVTGSSSCELAPARADNARSAPECGVDVGPSASIFKGCAIDGDCTLVRVANCTNSLPAYGVAKAKVDEFSQCFPFPSCRPVTDPTMRVETYAEDGIGNLDGGVIHVTCEHREGCPGMCRSHVP